MLYDILKYTVQGEPMDDIAELVAAIRASGKSVKEATKELRDRERIEVRDSVNLDRLLGTMPRTVFEGHAGPVVEVAVPVRPLLAYLPSDPIRCESIRSGTFTKVLRSDYVGLTSGFCLTTRAPINDLTLHDDFRHPGESRVEARERQMRAGYR